MTDRAFSGGAGFGLLAEFERLNLERLEGKKSAKVSDSAIRILELEAKLAKKERLATAKKPVESAFRIAELEAKIAEKERLTAVSESAIRIAELEAKLAEKERSTAISASAIRIAELEAKLAEKERSTAVSESTMRIAVLEAKLAEKERLATKKPAAVSASAIRIAELEAKLAKVSSKKETCKYFNSKAGCKNGDECKYLHEEDPAAMRRRLAEVEAELSEAKKFSKIRSSMASKLKSFGKKLTEKYTDVNSLDLVIVMDCTGSMSSWINEAKSQIIKIIDSVREDHENCTVRVGFVAYRDYCDGHLRIQQMALTEDLTKITTFIGTMTATGGGDGPEDIPGGLEAAIGMQWNGGAKCIILVADSPCHGSEYHNMSDDEMYAAQYRASPDIKNQMKHLSSNGFDFTFIDIIPTNCSKMIPLLKQAYSSAPPADGMTRTFNVAPLSSHVDVTHFKRIVSDSASASLAASKSRSVAMFIGGVKLSSVHHYGPTGHVFKSKATLHSIIEEDESSIIQDLKWDRIDRLVPIDAIRHSFHFRPGETINWENLRLKHTQQKTKLKLARNPFAKGAMRNAHGMIDITMNKRFAAKFYYGKAKEIDSEEVLSRRDVEMQAVAKKLAIDFSCSECINQGVDFIFTCWYEINSPEFGGKRYFTAEPFIVGEYKKYNNNDGWVNTTLFKSIDAGITLSTAEAFSHYSWQKTYGKLIVVDLQGVNSILTDPQIHSIDRERFGVGNLGEDGMASFFYTHKCNDVCRALGLASFAKGAKVCESVPKGLVPTTTVIDTNMESSCPLCGEFTFVMHSEFINAHKNGREVYCSDCATQIDARETVSCEACSEDFSISPYWYSMKGMEQPKTCKKCKMRTTSKASK